MTLPIQDFAQAIAERKDPSAPAFMWIMTGLEEATRQLTDREFFEVTNWMWREHKASTWRRATNNFNAEATNSGDDQ